MPQQEETPAIRSWLADEWATQITHVMESMTGDTPAVAYSPHEISSAEIDPSQTELIWWEQHFSGGHDAIAWIGATTKSWEEIGNRVLKSAGVDDGDQETIRSTYLEIIGQALSGVAGALSKRTRRETSCLEGRTAPPQSLADLKAYSFGITLGEQAFPVLALFSKSIEDLQETLPESSQPRALAPPSKPAAEETGKTHSIDLLL